MLTNAVRTFLAEVVYFLITVVIRVIVIASDTYFIIVVLLYITTYLPLEDQSNQTIGSVSEESNLGISIALHE